MKEIGGYFGMEPCAGREYYPNLLALNNGRNALLYLLKARNIRKLHIPYYLCDSVGKLCAREGFEFAYYSVDRDFLPVFDRVPERGEYLYIVNFYGQIGNETVSRLREKYGNILFDNAHAFFQPPVPGVDTLYTCRKFFGVPDGAYLATDAVLSEALEEDVSKDRMKHILGRFEGSASDYYGDFKANDHSFAELPLRKMSRLTHNLLGGIDYEAVRTRRNENYAVLAAALGAENPLKLVAPDGPYAYPFYCGNGPEVRRRLAERKIFVATLWPNVLETGDALARDYTESILPLPCDQRYDGEDMARVLRELELARRD